MIIICLDYELTTDVSAWLYFYNEIGRQHIEHASGCHYQSIVDLVVPQPTHGMWSEWMERSDHTPMTTMYVPYSYRTDCDVGSLTSPTNLSLSISQSFSPSISQSVFVSACQPVSLFVCQSVSLSISLSVDHKVSRWFSQSVSLCLWVSVWISQKVSLSVVCLCSLPVSCYISQSEGQSVGQKVSFGQSVSQSVWVGVWVSQKASWSVGRSVSQSVCSLFICPFVYYFYCKNNKQLSRHLQ